MKHLVFLYYTISYSIGLPAIVIFILAYLKTKNRTIGSYLPFLFSITLLMITVAVLRYQDVILSHPNTYPNVEAKYLYFIAESSLILTLPLFIHTLFKFRYIKQISVFFIVLYLIALGLVLSPFFLKFIPESNQLFSLPGFGVYRGILFTTITYGIILLILNYCRLSESEKIGKILLLSALVYTAISLIEMLHCELLPILKYLPLNIPLSPVAYFFFNLISLFYITKKIFLSPVSTLNNWEIANFWDEYKITDREKEIINLLISGYHNNEIGKKLYISASTVKTHIQNIYKKLGVQNRVQLVNLLKKIE